MNVYDPGDLVRVAVAFTDADGVATDPSTVTAKIREPDGTQTTYVYGTDAELAKASTGNYRIDVSTSQGGTYHVGFFFATGTGQAAAQTVSQFDQVISTEGETMTSGTMAPSGALTMKKIPARRAPLSWRVRNATRPHYLVGLFAWYLGHLFTRLFGPPVMLGRLDVRHIAADGTVTNYGAVGYRVVTTAFVNYVTDQLQTESSTFGDFKYHDSGVGTTAESSANTAMETTDGESRATGTQTESSANVYQSVGTISYTTTKAITEHGLFNDPTAGTLLDRTVFSAINVVNGDSIQFTYSLTLTAGS